MPSDQKMTEALNALTPELQTFRSALAATLEEVRGMVSTTNNGDVMHERIAAELGSFAAGRIRFDKFSDITHADTRYKKSALSSIRHAQQMLTATLALGDQLHVLEVERGTNLFAAANEALSTAGRAFAAAYAIEVIREGRGERRDDETLLAPLPPERWTRSERLVAPPLVIRVNGDDMNVGGFEDLLQGTQKIVLLVDGLAPPAALARLIAPGVFVMQCRATDDLRALKDAAGPAIAAVVESPSAVFTWNREVLRVDELPSELPKRPLRASTVFRQREDLVWLRTLEEWQRTRTADVATKDEQEPVEPGDKLAAWLLKQIEMPAS